MRLLLAIDESDYSQAALRTVIAQVRPRGTEVRVLHVVEPMTAYISAAWLPHFVSDTAEVERDRGREARAMVDRAVARLHKAGYRATGMVDEGDPKTKILDYADRWDADLIVMGSYGLKGLSRFLMGSVSDAVSRHARCSVEVVRVRPPRTRTARPAGTPRGGKRK